MVVTEVLVGGGTAEAVGAGGGFLSKGRRGRGGRRDRRLGVAAGEKDERGPCGEADGEGGREVSGTPLERQGSSAMSVCTPRGLAAFGLCEFNFPFGLTHCCSPGIREVRPWRSHPIRHCCLIHQAQSALAVPRAPGVRNPGGAQARGLDAPSRSGGGSRPELEGEE